MTDSRRSTRTQRTPALGGTVSRQEMQFILPESSTHMGTVFGGAGAIYAAAGLLVALLLWLRPPMPPLPDLSVLETPTFIFPNVVGPSSGGTSGGGHESNPLKPVRTLEQPLARLPEPLPQPVPEERLVPPNEVTPAAVVSTIPSDNLSALTGPHAPNPNGDGSGINGIGGPGSAGNGPGPGGPPGQNGGPDGGPGGPGGQNGVDIQVVALVTPKPAYTPQAMARHIEGDVALSCIVLATGRVGQCRITKSLDPNFGLDDEALKAAAKFVFRPAMRKGQPVPVTVNIVLEFHMR